MSQKSTDLFDQIRVDRWFIPVYYSSLPFPVELTELKIIRYREVSATNGL